MKTKYKYINFFQDKLLSKTSNYLCLNNQSGHQLGVVKWYGAWRQYCYFSDLDIVYSQGCLDDISHFLQQLKDERAKQSEKGRKA